MKCKRIFALLLIVAAVAMVSGCNPDPIDQEREAETTTSYVGGFIIEEYAPGYDMEWDEVG